MRQLYDPRGDKIENAMPKALLLAVPMQQCRSIKSVRINRNSRARSNASPRFRPYRPYRSSYVLFLFPAMRLHSSVLARTDTEHCESHIRTGSS